jgi:hypothetical protein
VLWLFFFFSDLFGLVVFLGVEPYCVRHWWVQLLYRPYCKKNPQILYSFIAKILWRSAKKDVIDQVSIFIDWGYYKKKKKSWDEKLNFHLKSFYFHLLILDPDTTSDWRDTLAPLFSSGKTFLSPSARGVLPGCCGEAQEDFWLGSEAQ